MTGKSIVHLDKQMQFNSVLKICTWCLQKWKKKSTIERNDHLCQTLLHNIRYIMFFYIAWQMNVKLLSHHVINLLAMSGVNDNLLSVSVIIVDLVDLFIFINHDNSKFWYCFLYGHPVVNLPCDSHSHLTIMLRREFQKNCVLLWLPIWLEYRDLAHNNKIFLNRLHPNKD